MNEEIKKLIKMVDEAEKRDVLRYNKTLCIIQRLERETKRAITTNSNYIKIFIENDQKMNSAKRNNLVIVSAYFIISTIFYMFGGYLLTYLNASTLQSVEFLTSILTAFLLFCVGIWGSYQLSLINTEYRSKINLNCASKYFAIFSAPIFACYLGYVTIDFGAINASASAIGFNIATIAKCMLIVLLLVDGDK